ncbi:MAG: hypothetical protein ACOCVL_00600 [Candidatus Sumerlaeota bacterium]
MHTKRVCLQSFDMANRRTKIFSAHNLQKSIEGGLPLPATENQQRAFFIVSRLQDDYEKNNA